MVQVADSVVAVESVSMATFDWNVPLRSLQVRLKKQMKKNIKSEGKREIWSMSSKTLECICHHLFLKRDD